VLSDRVEAFSRVYFSQPCEISRASMLQLALASRRRLGDVTLAQMLPRPSPAKQT
jgi:hypothetical protein